MLCVPWHCELTARHCFMRCALHCFMRCVFRFHVPLLLIVDVTWLWRLFTTLHQVQKGVKNKSDCEGNSGLKLVPCSKGKDFKAFQAILAANVSCPNGSCTILQMCTHNFVILFRRQSRNGCAGGHHTCGHPFYGPHYRYGCVVPLRLPSPQLAIRTLAYWGRANAGWYTCTCRWRSCID